MKVNFFFHKLSGNMAKDTHYLRDRLLFPPPPPPWLEEVGVLAEAPPKEDPRPSPKPASPAISLLSLLSGASFRFLDEVVGGGATTGTLSDADGPSPSKASWTPPR